MRVLFVVHQFLPRHAAGTEIYSYHLAKELQRRGHEVALMTTEFYGDKSQYEFSEKEHDGLRIFEVVHNHHFASFEQHFRDARMEERFTEVLDAYQPELVHFQHLHLHSVGYIDLAKARGLPVVYTLHEYILMCLRGGQLLRPDFQLCEGPDPELCAACATIYPVPGETERAAPGPLETRVKSSMPGPLRKLARAFRSTFGGRAVATAAPPEPKAADPYVPAVEARLSWIRERLQKVDLFVSPSAFLRERFIENGMIAEDRILHSDNGFHTEPFAEVGPHVFQEGLLRVGYVGTIAEYKGVHLIVEAFEGIEDPGIRCDIWGAMDTFPDYEKRLLAMEHGDRLAFRGRFDNRRIAEVLENIDVLIVPSLWFENSPLTIHEAYLAGIPVITADRGGMAELVEEGKTGLHFEMGSAESLRAAILRFAHEPQLRHELSKELPEIKTIAEDTDLVEARYRLLQSGGVPTR